jgi:predicted dehydrogenase
VTEVRIAVAGAGTIGRRHAEEIDAGPYTRLASIVDPGPAGPVVAGRYGVRLHRSLTESLTRDRPDGIVLATPNRMHVAGGLQCVAAGVPVLVEKPIGDSVEGATVLVEAGEAAGVPVLTGHHRTYSPIMGRAREIVRGGRLGRVVAVAGTALFRKPDDYFEAGGGWRRQPGGGPVLLNLVHDVNNLMSLAGDVVRVQATTSNAMRGFPVEDTAAVVLTFAGGALGTFLLSDAAASARSWELTSRENDDYPWYGDEDCYHVAGTAGSLSIPTMRMRTYPGKPSWHEPFTTVTEAIEPADPLAAQIAHFAAVVRGEAKPICSGRDGLTALRVVDAVAESARTGAPIDLR